MIKNKAKLGRRASEAHLKKYGQEKRKKDKSKTCGTLAGTTSTISQDHDTSSCSTQPESGSMSHSTVGTGFSGRRSKQHSHTPPTPPYQGIHSERKSYTFKEVVRSISMLTNSTKHCRSHAVRAAEKNSQSLMSLQQIRQVQRMSSISTGEEDLLFDAGYYSSAASKNKYVRLPAAAKATLILPSAQRDKVALQHVHKLFLQMKLLSQYPHQMQIELCRVGFYSSFSASRVIIRQGHRPFYFYIIISGSVLINEMARNPETGEMFATTTAVLEKGAQFGETALLLNNVRNATVVAQSDVELLVIAKQDFLPLFDAQIKGAQARDNPRDIEHIQFLMDHCEAFKRFPGRVLQTNPMNCVVHYFRKGSVVVQQMDTEWLYVVKSGSCSVVSVVPIESYLKDKARQIIECLRRNGYAEMDIYDLELNSPQQKEQNSRIREFIETPSASRQSSHSSVTPYNMTRDLESKSCDPDHQVKSSPDRIAKRDQAVTREDNESRDKSRDGKEVTVPPLLQRMGIKCTDPDMNSGNTTLTAAAGQQVKNPRSCQESFTCSRAHRESASSHHGDKLGGIPPGCRVCMFVCVRHLKTGDTFGFESLVSEAPDISLSVVSNNAEVVVVSKKMYQNFVPPDILISLKARFQNFPYPRFQDIVDTLHEQWQWFSYRKQLLRSTLTHTSLTVNG